MAIKLEIKNLHAQVEDKPILHGVNLTVPAGKMVALMGPNGSGKSTLSNVLMGHPNYVVTKGQVKLGSKDLLSLKPWERARLGLFLAFQYPYEIPGVSLYQFLLSASQAVKGEKFTQADFAERLMQAVEDLQLKEEFLDRAINEGFSGGEKKRVEILQLKVLEPKIVILDETDSGLDIDALRLVAENVNKLVSPRIGFLVITHYQRLLHYLQPDEVHVMQAGQIVKSGKRALAEKLEKEGYSWLRNSK